MRMTLACAAMCVLVGAATAADTKPRVLILTTGGTIAGQADPRSANGYKSGPVGAAQLIAAVPGIDKLAALSSYATPCHDSR